MYCISVYLVVLKFSSLIVNLFCLVSDYGLLSRPLRLPITVWRLAKVAIFTTNVDAENQCLINQKTVCGELNRHFCQTPVCALNGKYSSFNYLKEARE